MRNRPCSFEKQTFISHIIYFITSRGPASSLMKLKAKIVLHVERRLEVKKKKLVAQDLRGIERRRKRKRDRECESREGKKEKERSEKGGGRALIMMSHACRFCCSCSRLWRTRRRRTSASVSRLTPIFTPLMESPPPPPTPPPAFAC